MIGIDGLPFACPRWECGGLLVDEVAPTAIAAVSLLCECMATLCLVGSIVFHVDPELLRPVSELALPSVGTEALLHEVLA